MVTICRIITSLTTRFPGSYRTDTEGYTAIHRGIGIMTDDGDLGSRRRKSIFCRTKDDVVALIFQCMVVANDDIGMVIFYAFTGYRIMGTDEVVVLAIDQRRIEAIDIVELRRDILIKFCIPIRRPGTIIFLLISFDRIANTYDLGHVGIIYDVAAAKGHDLSATGRNGSLQGFA